MWKRRALCWVTFLPICRLPETLKACNASVCIRRLFLVYLDWHDSVENGLRDTGMPKRTTGKRDISFNVDKHQMLHSSAKYPICFDLLSAVSFPIFLYRSWREKIGLRLPFLLRFFLPSPTSPFLSLTRRLDWRRLFSFASLDHCGS